MNTRIHTTGDGEIIVQKQNVGVAKGSTQAWRKVAGPFVDAHSARQGELRYLKKMELENPNRLPLQCVTRLWKDVEINP